MDTWNAIRTERAALADALNQLSGDSWNRPSLCAGWSVREVVAHLIATARMTPPKFFGRMIASGFRFDAMTAAAIRQVLDGHDNGELVALYRALVDARSAPPGPATSWLGETIVHGEDIFRALGGYREHPADHVVAVAHFYAGSNMLIGAKNRIAGLRLRATDATWTHGDGPEAAGPLVALVLAMTGRVVATEDLTGDGVPLLRERS
ncbi:maleylpyruvate isomerase family mycothiol-dependent enzyme [Actinoplanes sp. KI2]|uniref:maleylpyruvate isomerase family mycothiol-dependent enzyme n=1 Tax=Actinoplanes sp. KI2 TaxID=2983315 RepID=UPI0021D5FBEC|nr:maleylpyruvate isomerase family mycothiol-dependent enzyme [Actinoplanes sp. KI2]MCU7727599.1 maleylpyruvate isomerase family mycothiol-dependent enzyme [Actinoplanes sp. KI2]